MFRPSEETLQKLESLIGHAFADRAYLESALVHGSAKTPMLRSNERLEFLGDAILGAVVSDYVFKNFPDLEEGLMTQVRASIVSRKNLARVARGLGLEHFMIVGKMYARPESITDSIIANAVEALIAAVYLDAGYAAATTVCLRHLEPMILEAARIPGKTDYKSILVQLSQASYGAPPEYRLESTTGPDHLLTFFVKVFVGGVEIAGASGSSKRNAEQEAARLALEALKKA